MDCYLLTLAKCAVFFFQALHSQGTSKFLHLIIHYLQPSHFIISCGETLFLCDHRILQSPWPIYLLCVVNSLSCQKTTVNGTAYTSEASTYLDTTRNYYNNKKKIFRMVTVPYFSMRSYMSIVDVDHCIWQATILVS